MCISTGQRIATPIEYECYVQKLGRKRPRKAVHFTEEASTISQSPWTVEELRSMWYQRRELTLFKLHARDYILGVANENNYETRGFERYDVERDRNKSLAIQCTLMAIKKGMKEEEVALVAQTCAEWSQNQAFELACKDFCEVYHPDMVGLLSDLPAPLDVTNKRAAECSGEGRRVRVRTC
jgi:hypothetical protein